MNWQPIETAPKDRDILVFNPVAGVYRTQAVANNKTYLWPFRFWDGKEGDWFPEPTQWCELPRPDDGCQTKI